MTWETDDDVVDWNTQSLPFLTALKQAGYFVRTVPVQGALLDVRPIDEVHTFVGLVAPKILRFLGERL